MEAASHHDTENEQTSDLILLRNGQTRRTESPGNKHFVSKEVRKWQPSPHETSSPAVPYPR